MLGELKYPHKTKQFHEEFAPEIPENEPLVECTTSSNVFSFCLECSSEIIFQQINQAATVTVHFLYLYVPPPPKDRKTSLTHNVITRDACI